MRPLLVLSLLLELFSVRVSAFLPPAIRTVRPQPLGYATSVSPLEDVRLHDESASLMIQAIGQHDDSDERAATESKDNHKSEESKLVLSTHKAQPQQSTFLASITKRIRQTCKTLWQALRQPSNRFRFGIGAVTAVSVASLTLWRPNLRVVLALRQWVQHRGFQGIAAAGRSVA